MKKSKASNFSWKYEIVKFVHLSLANIPNSARVKVHEAMHINIMCKFLYFYDGRRTD